MSHGALAMLVGSRYTRLALRCTLGAAATVTAACTIHPKTEYQEVHAHHHASVAATGAVPAAEAPPAPHEDSVAVPLCPAPPPARDTAVTEEFAWAIANAAAAAELCRIEGEHRLRDPAVRLPLSSYSVTSHRTCVLYPICPEYRFSFQHRPAVDYAFIPWTGHGMHFDIIVWRTTGRVRLVPGQ
jgi:hypothetical protein